MRRRTQNENHFRRRPFGRNRLTFGRNGCRNAFARSPKFIKLDGGGDGWRLPGALAPRPLGLDVMAGKYEDYQASGIRWQVVRPGCCEPTDRLRDMDEGGIWATVLYPNVGLGFGGVRGFA